LVAKSILCMDVEQSSRNLETVEALRSRFDDHKLSLSDSRAKYQSQVIEGSDEWREAHGDRPSPPDVLLSDTLSQMVCIY
jgi:hypothetical protein